MASRGDFGDVDAEAVVAFEAARFAGKEAWSDERRIANGRVVETRFNTIPGGAGVLVFRDVTERAEFVESLAERTALLEATLANIEEGIAVFSADRKLITANNDVIARMVDLPRAMLRPGMALEEVTRLRAARGDYGEVDPEALIQSRSAGFRKGQPWTATGRLPDGRTIDTRIGPMPNGRLVVVFRDVSERADYIAKLATQNTLLQATLENMGEGIIAYDAERRLLVANELAVRMVGAPADLIRPGAYFDDIVRFLAQRGDYGPDAEGQAEARIASFRKGERFTLVRAREGRTFEIRFNPSPNGGGVFLYHDTTESAAFQAKLAERTALLETTLHNMGEGIVVYDANHRLLTANTEFVASLLDVPPELAQPGARLEDLMRVRAERGDYGDRDVQSIVEAREAAFRAGKSLTVTARSSDNRTIDTRISAMPGGVVVIVFRDITEREDFIAKLADALRRAEQGSQAKSDFLAMASHELRTPMNAIIGLSGLCREGDMPPAEKRFVELIETAGETLLGIIEDLLEYASLSGSEPVGHVAPFDPRALVEGAIAIACPSSRAGAVSIRTAIDPAVPATMTGDGERIGRILASLLDNALKYTFAGSVTVRVSARRPPGADAATLRCEVEDTGVGFAPEETARLFEPFERGPITDRTRPAGLGLGLAIAQKLVDVMAGRIGAESAPGRGSRFWFEIPVHVAAPSDAPASAATPAPEARRRLKILVGEDIEANREVLRALLDKLGHEAHFAEDGAVAVAAAERDAYDVILMDIQMPNMDGLEATRAIRARGGRLGAVPILALSAYSLPADKEAAFAAGMTGFLAKPIRRSVLDAVLKSVCGDG